MILDVPVGHVIDDFHADYMEFKIDIEDYLNSKRVTAVRMHTTERSYQDKAGFLYVLAVPSLNFEAKVHQIIMDWRDEGIGPVIYDPNNGRPNRKHYVNKYPEHLLPGERVLDGWSYDFKIKSVVEG